ncbi:MAG: DUF2059 domain-containing protein [Rhizobiaceae bacterium]
MRLLNSARNWIAAGAVATAIVISHAAVAQEISEAHMKAARSAVAAIQATSDFDAILPQAALALKNQLISQNPDLQALIDSSVNEKALAMSSRRADLEKEAATVYAKVFSEEDLNAIATFYTSPAGKKLLADGPIVTREVLKAADIWQRGIARDLAQEVAKVLSDNANKAAGTTGAATPAPAQPQN